MKLNIIFLKKSLMCAMMVCAMLNVAAAPANGLEPENATQPTDKVEPPTVHNPKIDNMFKCFFGGENAASTVDTMLAETYRTYGTYMATVIIQHQIDYNMFLAFVNGDSWMLKQFPNNNARHKAAVSGDNTMMRTKKANIMVWMDSNYVNLYTRLFSQFDHKPMADELVDALDKYVEKNEFNTFGGDYNNDYVVPSEAFKRQQDKSNQSQEQKASDLVAYKIYLADMMLFRQLISSVGVNLDSKLNEKLKQTYMQGYMPTIAPTAL